MHYPKEIEQQKEKETGRRKKNYKKSKAGMVKMKLRPNDCRWNRTNFRQKEISFLQMIHRQSKLEALYNCMKYRPGLSKEASATRHQEYAARKMKRSKQMEEQEEPFVGNAR